MMNSVFQTKPRTRSVTDKFPSNKPRNLLSRPGIKVESEEKFEKILGGMKSNFEHFTLLQLLSNLHRFLNIQKISCQNWFD
jgi:hypothetical protein